MTVAAELREKSVSGRARAGSSRRRTRRVAAFGAAVIGATALAGCPSFDYVPGSGGATASGSGAAMSTSSVTGQSSSTGCSATMTDPANCGACGHDCQGGTCESGACQPLLMGSVSEPIGPFAISPNYVFFVHGVGTAAGTLVRVPKSMTPGSGSLDSPANVATVLDANGDLTASIHDDAFYSPQDAAATLSPPGEVLRCKGQPLSCAALDLGGPPAWTTTSHYNGILSVGDELFGLVPDGTASVLRFHDSAPPSTSVEFQFPEQLARWIDAAPPYFAWSIYDPPKIYVTTFAQATNGIPESLAPAFVLPTGAPLGSISLTAQGDVFFALGDKFYRGDTPILAAFTPDTHAIKNDGSRLYFEATHQNSAGLWSCAIADQTGLACSKLADVMPAALAVDDTYVWFTVGSQLFRVVK